jgi:hypothetical protein
MAMCSGPCTLRLPARPVPRPCSHVSAVAHGRRTLLLTSARYGLHTCYQPGTQTRVQRASVQACSQHTWSLRMALCFCSEPAKQMAIPGAQEHRNSIGRAQTGWKMSRNLDLNVLHVRDAAAWAANTAWRPVAGDSLVFDYIYFMHPVRPFKQKKQYLHMFWLAVRR